MFTVATCALLLDQIRDLVARLVQFSESDHGGYLLDASPRCSERPTGVPFGSRY